MLEVKLKDIVENNTVKTNGNIQYWINPSDAKIITVHLREDRLRLYYVGDGGNNWTTKTIAEFTKVFINDICYEECNENWERYNSDFSASDITDIVEIKGINYWKTKDGVLYMSMWNRLHGIEATLIPMNITTSRPVVYPRPVNLLDEMKRLNLYKVSNIRLEEF